MTGTPRKTRARIDGDGVKVVEVAGVRRGVWLLTLALLIAGAAGVLALRLALRGDASSAADVSLAAAPDPPAPAPEPAAAAPRRLHAVRRVSAPAPAPAPVPVVASNEAPRATAPELPQFPAEPNDAPSGIALFPPLGTDPPKRGILVPDDFELPEGYVRHHQATDDGASLPAILMFHPDYEWLDENGVALPLPADRVVPPELAPPGMPITLLELPASKPEAAP